MNAGTLKGLEMSSANFDAYFNLREAAIFEIPVARSG